MFFSENCSESIHICKGELLFPEHIDTSHDIEEPSLGLDILLLSEEVRPLPVIEDISLVTGFSILDIIYLSTLRDRFEEDIAPDPPCSLRSRREWISSLYDIGCEVELRYHEEVYDFEIFAIIQSEKTRIRRRLEPLYHSTVCAIGDFPTERVILRLELILFTTLIADKVSDRIIVPRFREMVTTVRTVPMLLCPCLCHDADTLRLTRIRCGERGIEY